MVVGHPKDALSAGRAGAHTLAELLLLLLLLLLLRRDADLQLALLLLAAGLLLALLPLLHRLPIRLLVRRVTIRGRLLQLRQNHSGTLHKASPVGGHELRRGVSGAPDMARQSIFAAMHCFLRQ